MALPSLARSRERLTAVSPSQLTGMAEWLASFGPALIILTLPLEFTAKYMGQPVVRWLMVLVAAALLYLVVTRHRTIVLPRQRSVIWLAVFVAVSVISWLLTRAPSSQKAFADVALYPVFGVMIMNLVIDDRDHRRAWTAFLVSGLGVATLGFILQVAHLHIWTPNPIVANRLNITFADPNITARFLTLVSAASVILFATRRAHRWLCLVSGAACAIVVPMTWSRSGLALFIISMLIAAAVVGARKRSFAIAVVLLAVFAFSTVVNPATRIRAIGAYDAFASLAGVGGVTIPAPQAAPGEGGDTVLSDNRRYLVEAGVRMFRDHPVFGVGYGAFQHQLSTTYSYLIPPNLPLRDVASHTALVTIASEMGVIGLLLFLVFLLQLGRESFRARRNVWVVLPAMLLVPILFFAEFEGRLIEEPYFWLCLALVYAAMRLEEGPRIRSHTM
jgi:putative inorganic carbon (hco3(-)) transporter